jgi:PAS domain-containing protein
MDRLKKLLNQPSVRVVLVYIAFSAIWIAFTDRIVEQFYTDPSTIRQVQTIKGWLFVLASGGVLIWVIKITGRQLEINRDQYKTMLGDANIGIARLENMKMVSSNPAFRNILGRNSREQAELTFFEFIDEHARHGFREAVKSLENQKTIQQ